MIPCNNIRVKGGAKSSLLMETPIYQFDRVVRVVGGDRSKLRNVILIVVIGLSHSML